MSFYIRNIDNNAFQGCKALKSFNFNSANLQSIGEFAFANSGLETVDMSTSKVSSIDAQTFHGCTSLEEVKLNTDGTLKNIGRMAFGGTSSLEKINIPNSVETFGSSVVGDSKASFAIASNGFVAFSPDLFARGTCKITLQTDDGEVYKYVHKNVNLIDAFAEDIEIPDGKEIRFLDQDENIVETATKDMTIIVRIGLGIVDKVNISDINSSGLDMYPNRGTAEIRIN